MIKLLKKQNNGITLIALVITIIILLILAGVSIAMLTGDNGILTRAGEAKNRTNEAAEDEQRRLSSLEEQIDYRTQGWIGGIYNVDKKVNAPKIKVSEMIPIKRDGSNWVVCSTTDNDWYSYDGASNEWANIMLSDGTYQASSVTVGQIIQESELRKYVCMDTKICI